MTKTAILIRSHHIRQFGIGQEIDPDRFAEKVFLDQPIDYKTGTRKEQEGYKVAIAKAAEAIRDGRIIDIGESGPDIVCNACLRVDCRDSGVGSVIDLEKRRRALEAIVGELVLEQTRRDMTRRQGHEFICDRINFHLEGDMDSSGRQ